MLTRDVLTSTGIAIGRVGAAAAIALCTLPTLSACGQKGALVLARPLPSAGSASSAPLAR